MRSAGPELPLGVEVFGTRGRPLVMVHGFGARSFTWRHWVPTLAEDHRVHLLDLMGHGGAPAPADGDYSPRGHADLVRRYLVERELEGATLVGHSLGGGLVLLAALDLLDGERDRLDSLVLISAASLPQEIPPFIGMARIPVLGELLLTLLPSRWLIRRVLRSILHDPEAVRPEQVEAYAGPLGERARRRALLRTARRILPPDLDELVADYARIDLPALLLWGRSDPVVPPTVGRALEGILPRARLHLLDRVGHLPQEEAPERALEPVRAFLRRRPSARPE